ncbi:hypothetical protein PRZ48_006748 [Zasmidium cellare]|uniref:Peptidase S8/S53 domain-containing protein n=1 Tax=Zasmidium cellare TaxID=395010 RepID=A0ABR0EPY5_ZASCE|nr:hypothetical protein PRZ48_006748 [Zasmidium cellare]
MDDAKGHGTHVAGTIGGAWVGIAPSANLINVKVLGTKGGNDVQIARAINHIIDEHNNNKKSHANDWDFRGSVINMSFTARGRSTILSNAVDAAKAAGIFLVAAAGNDNVEAGNIFPCSYATVHCVGATDYKYAKADFSNYGRGLSSVAPGVDIVSASNLDDKSVRRDSGTSMAAPHVAGAAAIFVMWEALGNDAGTTSVRMNQNSHDSWTDGFYQALNPFTTTGILDSRRSWRGPYVYAPYWPVRHVSSADTDLETTYDTGVSTTDTGK